MKCNFFRDRADKVFDKRSIKMNSLAAYISADALPIVKRNLITKYNANIFENIKRGFVNHLNLILAHWLCER